MHFYRLLHWQRKFVLCCVDVAHNLVDVQRHRRRRCRCSRSANECQVSQTLFCVRNFADVLKIFRGAQKQCVLVQLQMDFAILAY